MRVFRVYLDTSAVGGCFDAEFSVESLRLIELVRAGKIRALLSDVVIAELVDAPPSVQQVVASLPSTAVERVELAPAVFALRDAYVSAGILAPRWMGDATHVAAATVAGADAIASWNFKHIVRLDKIKAYNEVNVANGYGPLTILTPAEIRVDDVD